ncbi:ATP-binding cassette domain-containing protein [uncultured Sphingomonas sp.]|uniref:ATP-binding cassette domain-containing protein n=1 Tax=uncultured Sphingomonas sp. TaxID=158754 RepID=UPI0025EDC6F4|nr:ATP-binding cassette domain-containing protein [uncultured Sphingomonas sp.]
MSAAIRLIGAVVDRGGQRIVHGVDLAVQSGAWFGLIGANGSGKTSLLRALAGRLPFAGGTCSILGQDVASDRVVRAACFGFAPPADKLPDSLRGRDILALVGGTVEAALPKVGAVGDALGVRALLDRWIGDCSAGMRQRLAIAAAFAGGHDQVILDEPFNWLDPVAAFDLRHALRQRVDAGLTLLTALHDLTTLAVACDAGLMLAEGKVAMTLEEGILRDAARDPHAFERYTIDRLRA